MSGKTSIQAIKREVYEEIGLKVQGKILKLINRHRDERFFRDVYLIIDDISLENIEVQEINRLSYISYSLTIFFCYKGHPKLNILKRGVL